MRRTVDTNVLVRGLVDDGTEQSRIADRLMGGAQIFVPSSVILETEWILRACFAAGRERVVELLTGLLGMANVEVESRAVVADAVVAHASGLDFADALHLYSARETEAFMTFDDRLRRKAKRLADTVPVLAPSIKSE